jgi:hypothetical protein
MKYIVTIDHGNGSTGTYRVDAANRTEARKVCPFKNKIAKIEVSK